MRTMKSEEFKVQSSKTENEDRERKPETIRRDEIRWKQISLAKAMLCMI